MTHVTDVLSREYGGKSSWFAGEFEVHVKGAAESCVTTWDSGHGVLAGVQGASMICKRERDDEEVGGSG